VNIVIVGAGEFGSTLAETLAGEDNNIKVVDMNDSRLARLAGTRRCSDHPGQRGAARIARDPRHEDDRFGGCYYNR